MTSIQTLWALASHLGVDPAELLAKTGEKLVADASSKAITAAGRRMVGSVQAVFLQLMKQINDSFPDYLRKQLHKIDQSQRSAIIEAAFSEWMQAHANEAAELERLLFRIIYLRALVDYCSNLPVIGGIESRLNLDDVWVPQTFRALRSDQPRQRHTDDLRFETLSQALASGSASLVLTGVSGAGKSTQLRKLVLDQARWQLETTNFDQLLAEPLPIYLNAETLARERSDLTTALAHAIMLEMGLRLPFAIPVGFFDPRQPGAPRSLIIAIDGLDEISPERRDDLIHKIKNHGENFRIILASRTALAWPEFAQFELEEPSPEQADVLIGRLAPNGENYQLVRSANLPRNPLVLTLSALLRRQKVSSHAALYREFVIDRLMRSHDLALRKTQVGFELLKAAADLDSTLAEHAERLATGFGLLPDGLQGLAKNEESKDTARINRYHTAGWGAAEFHPREFPQLSPVRSTSARVSTMGCAMAGNFSIPGGLGNGCFYG